MTRWPDGLEHALRAGHPEVDRYDPAPFDDVVRRLAEERSRPGLADLRGRRLSPRAVAAGGLLATAAAVVLAVGLIVSLLPVESPPGAGIQGDSPADRAAIAALAGVDPSSILFTEDGAVVVRRNLQSGTVELLIARQTDGRWHSVVIDQFQSLRTPAASGVDVESITCSNPGLRRPTFVFGERFPDPGRAVRVFGAVDVVGGTFGSDGTFLVAIAGASAGGRLLVVPAGETPRQDEVDAFLQGKRPQPGQLAFHGLTWVGGTVLQPAAACALPPSS